MARRGLFQNFFLDKAKAYVLKFAARIAVGQGIKFLERNVSKGIVNIASLDPSEWKLIDGLSDLSLPDDRPARILLFVHGTFSSTIGAYGSLAATPWGKSFLEGARANYDAVIGFNHATLGEDPLANATELLGHLESFEWKFAPHFDVVAHSRGGLVYRSLVEHLLPRSNLQAHFDRVIFAACTNRGTLLAEPDNWRTFIDLYTNLAVASCRVIGLIPQAKAVTIVLKEIIQGLGAFVKYCVTVAVTEGEVPGIAAVQPQGDFIKKINEAQEGQPTIEKSHYCAITSEFEPRILGGDHEPKELPRRFVQWIVDVFSDQIIREANDLVVDTASMTSIDPAVGNFIKGTLDFGKNPQVYHTNYFVQPDVVNAMTSWLRLIQPEAMPATRSARRAGDSASRKRSATASKLGARPRSRGAGPRDLSFRAPTRGRESVPIGSIVGPEVPGTVDTDILVTFADTSVRECLECINKKLPSYVVVRRDYEGDTLDYAFGAEEVVATVKGQPSTSLLIDALDLHESDASPSGSVTEVLAHLERVGGSHPSQPTVNRFVVLDKGRPIGVLPGSIEPLSAERIAERARIATGPHNNVERILRTRTMPTFSTRGIESATPVVRTRGTRGRSPASTSRAGEVVAPTVTCYFHAEMESELIVARATSIEVLVSREVIDRLTGPAATQGESKVDPSKKLLLQIFPKKNFEIMGDDRAEIDPPAPGTPQQLYFDLRPTHEGEGEVWVIARQGQVPLVTLVLKPQIVKAKSGETRRVAAEATTGEAPPLAEPLNQLFILEQLNGNQCSYKFMFQSPGLNVMEWELSKPFKGDRRQYVESLYRKIEKRWLSTNNDLEKFSKEMRELGGQLLDELFPEKLQQLLWDHRKDLKSIMVISEEPFIPWELVHLKPPGKTLPAETIFLGQMGLVRWLQEAGWPPTLLKIRKSHARYVIPNYPVPEYVLPEAQLESKFLKDKFGATSVEADSDAVRDLLQTPGAFDLLHFACHGHAEQDNISDAGLLMKGRVEGGQYVEDFLTATTAEQSSNLKADDGTRAIVVLNACQVGRSGYQLTGLGGFAQAFLKREAGAFVGTLWSVGDSPARTFTETFYKELLKKLTIANATIAAREAARAGGDATWLAYVVYANPQATVSKK